MANSVPGRSTMITGLFKDPDHAERAYRAALDLGYESSDINVVMSDETRERHFSSGRRDSALQDKAAKSAEKPVHGEQLGGPIGGTMGTIAPIIAAVGTLLLIPGILIAGPVAVALTAAGAVGLAGGLVGALTDWGIPKSRINQYEAEVRGGGILIGVKPRSDDDARRLSERWSSVGGEVAP